MQVRTVLRGLVVRVKNGYPRLEQKPAKGCFAGCRVPLVSILRPGRPRICFAYNFDPAAHSVCMPDLSQIEYPTQIPAASEKG